LALCKRPSYASRLSRLSRLPPLISHHLSTLTTQVFALHSLPCTSFPPPENVRPQFTCIPTCHSQLVTEPRHLKDWDFCCSRSSFPAHILAFLLPRRSAHTHLTSHVSACPNACLLPHTVIISTHYPLCPLPPRICALTCTNILIQHLSTTFIFILSIHAENCSPPLSPQAYSTLFESYCRPLLASLSAESTAISSRGLTTCIHFHPSQPWSALLSCQLSRLVCAT
jgi:hypothetical protein